MKLSKGPAMKGTKAKPLARNPLLASSSKTTTTTATPPATATTTTTSSSKKTKAKATSTASKKKKMPVVKVEAAATRSSKFARTAAAGSATRRKLSDKIKAERELYGPAMLDVLGDLLDAPGSGGRPRAGPYVLGGGLAADSGDADGAAGDDGYDYDYVEDGEGSSGEEGEGDGDEEDGEDEVQARLEEESKGRTGGGGGAGLVGGFHAVGVGCTIVDCGKPVGPPTERIVYTRCLRREEQKPLRDLVRRRDSHQRERGELMKVIQKSLESKGSSDTESDADDEAASSPDDKRPEENPESAENMDEQGLESDILANTKSDIAQLRRRTLFVLNLPPQIPEDFLHAVFDRCGPIDSITIVLETRSPFPPVCPQDRCTNAYVSFESSKGLVAALDLTHVTAQVPLRTCGLRKWQTEMYTYLPTNLDAYHEHLANFTNKRAQAYQQKVAQEMEQKREEANKPDADGFIRVPGQDEPAARVGGVVVQGHKVNRRVLRRLKSDPENRFGACRLLPNFYTFQLRDKKHKQLSAIHTAVKEQEEVMNDLKAMGTFS